MILAKLSWQNQMVDPVVIFSRAFSLRAVHSVAREVPRVVLRRRLLQFALVRSPAWEGRRAALNSWPQAARFSDYGSGRQRVWRCFCREANDSACGGVSSRGRRWRVVRLCVVKRSRRTIRTLCHDMSRWKFPLYGAKRSQRRAGDRKPRGRRDRSAFAKSSGVGQK